MTVESELVRAGPYYPNGVTVAFPFGFRAISDNDVEFVRVEAGGSQVAISSALYNTVINPDGESGTISFTAPLAASALAHYIQMKPAFDQLISLENQSGYLPEVLTEALDQSAQRDLWLRDGLGRALVAPSGESFSPLPLAANRANKVMRFGAGGDIDLIDDVASSEGVAVAAATQAGVSAAQAAGAAGALTLKNYYVKPDTGSDVNEGTRAAPFATLAKAGTVALAGDTIWLWPGAVLRENFVFASQTVPDGVNVKVHGGGKAIFQGFDKYTGAWTANAGAYYTTANIVHLFGGVGAKVGANRFYPGAIYRTAAGQKWKQLIWKYPNDFANDAAGIAFVQANPGYGYVQDMSGSGSSYTAGWQQGNFRYHVNLGGTDPATCSWLVHQRSAPNFGRYHELQGLNFHGNVHHDGIVARQSHFDRCEISFPRFHGCEITGSTSHKLRVRDGNAGGAGYAFHQFEPAGANWPIGRSAEHVNTELINWPGAAVGCHSSDVVNGGGGAGYVAGVLRFIDAYFENVNHIGNGSGITNGIIFDNPVFNRIGSIYGSFWDITLNNPRITQGRPVTDIGVYSANQRLFGTGTAGFRLTVNGGSSVSSINTNFITAAGGSLMLSKHKAIFGATNFGGEFITHTADHQGVIIEDSVIQFEGFADRQAGSATSTTNPTANRPVTLTRSHLAGIAQGVATQAGVTIDEHTYLGGHSGLEATHDPFSPVRAGKLATVWSIGERVVGASFGIAGGRSLGMITTAGVYYSQGALEVPQWPLPAGFVPRGIVGLGPSVNSTYIYGLGGKIYKAIGTAAFNLVASGTAKDFTGHLVAGTLIFLGCSDGSIYKLDTATDIVTSVTSPVAWRILGGITAGSTANLILFGYNADESAGGYIYSTDSGATWTAGAAAGKMTCAAWVNGNVILSVLGGTFFTGTTVGGAMTAQNGWGGPEVKSMAVDATGKKVLVVGTMRNASAGGATKRNGRWTTCGWIDAGDAAPANWRYKGRASPIPAPLFAVQSNGGSFDVLVTFTEYAVFGGVKQMAVIEQVDGSDWYYWLPHPELVGMADARSTDDLGFTVAV